MSDTRQHVHELIDRLPAPQLTAVARLLEVMVDPVALAIASAPIDDEPVSEEERRAVAEADEWLKHNEPIPFEDVLADFRLTLEDVKNHQDRD
jgi:hypothetical protein